MKVLYTRHNKQDISTVEQLAELALIDQDYRDRTDSLNQTVKYLAHAIGMILKILYKRRLIDEADMSTVLTTQYVIQVDETDG